MLLLSLSGTFPGQLPKPGCKKDISGSSQGSSLKLSSEEAVWNSRLSACCWSARSASSVLRPAQETEVPFPLATNESVYIHNACPIGDRRGDSEPTDEECLLGAQVRYARTLTSVNLAPTSLPTFLTLS